MLWSVHRIGVLADAAASKSQMHMDNGSKLKGHNFSSTRLSTSPSLMQGLCGLDTVLEHVVSECGEDKADSGRRPLTRDDFFFPKIESRST